MAGRTSVLNETIRFQVLPLFLVTLLDTADMKSTLVCLSGRVVGNNYFSDFSIRMLPGCEHKMHEINPAWRDRVPRA